MAIPSPGEDLNKADSLFNQPSGHKALFSEFGSFFSIETVGLLGLFRFSFQINYIRYFHLHAISQFIALHPRFQFFMVGMFYCMLFIEKCEFIESLSLM